MYLTDWLIVTLVLNFRSFPCWHRTPTMPYVPAPTPAKSKLSGAQSQLSSRRSRQAKMRAMKMRRLYSNEQQVGLLLLLLAGCLISKLSVKYVSGMHPLTLCTIWISCVSAFLVLHVFFVLFKCEYLYWSQVVAEWVSGLNNLEWCLYMTLLLSAFSSSSSSLLQLPPPQRLLLLLLSSLSSSSL